MDYWYAPVLFIRCQYKLALLHISGETKTIAQVVFQSMEP